MLALNDKRPKEVARAQRVMREIAQRDPFGHIHLKRELDAGNEYARALLFARGCEYIDGAIRRTQTIRNERDTK